MQVALLDYQDPSLIFPRFAGQPFSLWLDSARYDARVGRYSFIAIDPFATLRAHQGQTWLNDEIQPAPFFTVLEDLLQRYAQPSSLPFAGGIAGYWGYHLARELEKLPAHRIDDQRLPDAVLGCYDVVMGFDHLEKKSWIVSTGAPIFTTERAHVRLAQMRAMLKKPFDFTPSPATIAATDITSNFTRDAYVHAVQQSKDYIEAGHFSEINIAQRFQAPVPASFDKFSLYYRLRKMNPAPFAAYFNTPFAVLASASPERFLHVRERQVETRPIKGTRKRAATPNEDKQLRDELHASLKDRAENIMIVDLMRNDLSRVCKTESVQVTQLCEVETYASVHHLVSAVTGELCENKNNSDLLRATFPAGSVTGAPKIHAIEKIAELEPHARGAYCGSMGYMGFNASMDLSVTIRSLVVTPQLMTFHAGGAIVSDSEPLAEYQETLDKARALQQALISTALPSATTAAPIVSLEPSDKQRFARNMITSRREAVTQRTVLIIDNYDSFVYNLARYVGKLGFAREVHRNDALTLADINALQPSHIILSPGPCSPDEAGICLELVRHHQQIPLLGVCLGHQAIAQAFGGKVLPSHRPVHGKSSRIQHDGKNLFMGLANPLEVARYHSLIVSPEDFPAQLMIQALAEDGDIMAIQHRQLPIFGVQFHPESVLTYQGIDLLKNFLQVT